MSTVRLVTVNFVLVLLVTTDLLASYLFLLSMIKKLFIVKWEVTVDFMICQRAGNSVVC